MFLHDILAHSFSHQISCCVDVLQFAYPSPIGGLSVVLVILVNSCKDSYVGFVETHSLTPAGINILKYSHWIRLLAAKLQSLYHFCITTVNE